MTGWGELSPAERLELLEDTDGRPGSGCAVAAIWWLLAVLVLATAVYHWLFT